MKRHCQTESPHHLWWQPLAITSLGSQRLPPKVVRPTKGGEARLSPLVAAFAPPLAPPSVDAPPKAGRLGDRAIRRSPKVAKRGKCCFATGRYSIGCVPKRSVLKTHFIIHNSLFNKIMPIGVPKVPFRIPGEPTAQWVDLFNRLYRDRVLFLCNELKDELANQLIGIMLFLNGEEERKGLFMYINSPGGSVTCGIGVYDTMHFIDAEVTTICAGTAASVASFVLAGGEIGKRIAFPNARIMIHQRKEVAKGKLLKSFLNHLRLQEFDAR